MEIILAWIIVLGAAATVAFVVYLIRGSKRPGPDGQVPRDDRLFFAAVALALILAALACIGARLPAIGL